MILTLVKINWYPISHTPTAIPAAEDFFKVGIIMSERPVLSSRQKYLQNGAFCQEYLSTEHRYLLNKHQQQIIKSDNHKAECSSQKSKKREGVSKHPHSTLSAQRREKVNVKFADSRLEDKKLAQRDVDNSLMLALEKLKLSWNCGVIFLTILVLVNLSISCYGRD